ncbi:MAG: heavy-metal-associated domain-containing protein [Bacteroidia bacterium]
MHTIHRISNRLSWPSFLWAAMIVLYTLPARSSDFGENGSASCAGIVCSTAQKPPKKKEIRFMVKGNCGQCEQRIVDALDQKGIIAAGWDRQKQEAWVVFRPGVVTEEQIHTYIAAAGHDTALKKADSVVYKGLPQCCLYRDGLNVHE